MLKSTSDFGSFALVSVFLKLPISAISATGLLFDRHFTIFDPAFEVHFVMSNSKDQIIVQASSVDGDAGRASSSSARSSPKDPAVGVAQSSSREEHSEQPADQVDEQKKGFLAYFKTKEFYITVALG